jgi:hypothetical protein
LPPTKVLHVDESEVTLFSGDFIALFGVIANEA